VPYPRKSFHIGDILTLVTGYDVSLHGEAGYQALEDYVAGRPLGPSDLVAHGMRIAQHVRAQFPGLRGYDDADIPQRELLEPWLERRARDHGEYLPVTPLNVTRADPCHAEAGRCVRDAALALYDADALPSGAPRRGRATSLLVAESNRRSGIAGARGDFVGAEGWCGYSLRCNRHSV
jgi:hypothetical protein